MLTNQAKYAWLFESIGGVQKLFSWCLQADFANKTISIAGRGLKSQMLSMSLHSCFPLMVNSTSLVFLLYHLVSAWCDVHNVLITFLVYLSIHTSAVKYLKQNQWFDKWWTNRQCFTLPCLPLRHYCMKLLAFGPFPPVTQQEDSFLFPIEPTE